MKMIYEEALEIAKEFLDFITDENGNIKETVLILHGKPYQM